VGVITLFVKKALLTSSDAPSSVICFSSSLRISSGSLPQTRLLTLAVVDTTIGMGTATLAAMPPAASTLPIPWRASLSTLFEL
jgi:hypothetical protein